MDLSCPLFVRMWLVVGLLLVGGLLPLTAGEVLQVRVRSGQDSAANTSSCEVNNNENSDSCNIRSAVALCCDYMSVDDVCEVIVGVSPLVMESQWGEVEVVTSGSLLIEGKQSDVVGEGVRLMTVSAGSVSIYNMNFLGFGGPGSVISGGGELPLVPAN